MSWNAKRKSRAAPAPLVDSSPDAHLVPPHLRPDPAAASAHTTSTGNKKLDRQRQAFHYTETREVPVPTPATAALAQNARALMFEASGGHYPNLSRDSRSELLRDEFLESYFGSEKLEELPDIMNAKREKEPGIRWKRFKRHIIKDPLVPLALRFLVFVFAVASLVFAGLLLETTYAVQSPCGRVDDLRYLVVWPAMTTVYILLVTMDEVRAAPIGLRKPVLKFALTVSDFLFASFHAAATALAFSVYGDWHCDALDSQRAGTSEGEACGKRSPNVCHAARVLSVLLLVSALAWAAMFAVTIARLMVVAAKTPSLTMGGGGPMGGGFGRRRTGTARRSTMRTGTMRSARSVGLRRDTGR